MIKQLANTHWLLNNNNNNSPQRPQNQLRPGQNGRPNGQSPQGGSPINRWLFIIVLVMLAIYAYSYFNPANSSNSAQRTELTYSAFYDQINAGNVKTAVFNGQTDIIGELRNPPGQLYHVVQLPNGDDQLSKALIAKGVTVSSQPAQDNSFWFNLLIAF